jgi:uncharacterized membrane protein YccC
MPCAMPKARVAPTAARVAGYICGVIVLLDVGAQPWHYAFFRMIETALGVLVAWGLSFVPELLRSDQDREEGR